MADLFAALEGAGSPTKLYAVVVAAREGKNLVASIMTGSPAMMEDLDRNFSGRDAHDSLGAPAAPGFWMWEGTIQLRRSHEGDYDEDYVGEYRPLTTTELVKLHRGVSLWFEEWQDWERTQMEMDRE